MKNKKFWLIIVLVIGMYVLVLRPIIADSDAQLNSTHSPTVVNGNETTSSNRSEVVHDASELNKSNSHTRASSSENSHRTHAPRSASSNRLVYITGAVESPGLYEIEEDATIGDVIQLSGGFLPYAAVERLNLAQMAEEGSHIHVGFNFNGNPEILLQKKKVNINTADEKGLTALAGIGPGTAKKILDYRAQHGAFKSIEELKQIKGIGEATFKKLAPHVTI